MHTAELLGGLTVMHVPYLVQSRLMPPPRLVPWERGWAWDSPTDGGCVGLSGEGETSA